MEEIFRAIESVKHFISRSDVLELGLDDRDIRRFVGRRAWTRVRQGAYCFTDTWSTKTAEDRHRVLARAVVSAHGDAVALSHVSGALHQLAGDVWGVDLSRVHVTRRDGRSGSVERDVVHHEGPVSDDDLLVVDGIPTLPPAVCVAQTALRAPLEAGLTLIDSSLHRATVQLEEMWDLRHQMGGREGARTLDLALRLADSRAESVGETRSRFLYWRQGLPKPEVQFQVYDAAGVLIAITDLAWPWLGLMYEFDGRVKYGRLLLPGQAPGDVVFEEKKREDLLRRVTGMAMERATWADLSTPAALARRTRNRMSPREQLRGVTSWRP